LQVAQQPLLDKNFFDQLSRRELPTPTELADNMLLLLAERSNGRPGSGTPVNHRDPSIASTIGALDENDVFWAVRELTEENLLKGTSGAFLENGYITGLGWRRIDELRRAHISSQFAFFARKFANAELDRAFAECLQPAVKQTGYELRIVT
jgi:hypothetical protein